MRVESSPPAGVAAGIDERIGLVVRGELQRAQPEPVEGPQQMQIAIQVEAAFQIQECRHLAPAVNAFDGRGRERQLQNVLVFLDLFQSELDDAEGVLHFEAAGIIRLRRIDRKKHRVESAGAGARQVKMAVGITLADVEPFKKLPRHHVNVAVHHERIAMERGHLAQNRRGAYNEKKSASLGHDAVENSVPKLSTSRDAAILTSAAFAERGWR